MPASNKFCMVLKDEGWSRCPESFYGCNGCNSRLASSPTKGFYPTGKVSSLHSLDRTNWEDVGSIDDEGAVENMKAEDVLSIRTILVRRQRERMSPGCEVEDGDVLQKTSQTEAPDP